MATTDDQTTREFLDELTKLSDRYGVVIGGCGCCGSPWLDKLNGERVLKYEADENDIRGFRAITENDPEKLEP
jgi:Zn-finger nucleic acid-binding protein